MADDVAVVRTSGDGTRVATDSASSSRGVSAQDSQTESTRTVVDAASTNHRSDSHGTAARHIRSSTVLLVGRVLTLALNFGSHLLLARYLSRADYGAMSYALAVVSFLQGFATFELSSALSRWLPLYRERRRLDAAFGSVVLAVAFVTIVGSVISALLIVGIPRVGVALIDDPEALRLLVILALLIPIQSLDALVMSLFAVLGDARAILIRGSILSPGLRIVLVAALVATHASVTVLAWGYLAINTFSLVIYAGALWRSASTRQLLKACRPRDFAYPLRELFGFSWPLVVTVLVWSLMEYSDAIMLGYFHGVDAVAAFRAVSPLAQLNKVVTLAFGTMYLPVASRLYARGEANDLSELYWRTAVWMGALSFPVFLFTFSFARPTASLLYGQRYLDSAPVLSLLSLGYFVNAALGFNGLTLKTFNKIRFTVSIDIFAAVLNVAVNFMLIPRWGAVGAATGTCATMIIHNMLKQFGLWKYTGIPAVNRAYVPAYVALLGLPVLLLVVQAMLSPSLWVALPLAAAAILVVLRAARHVLAVNVMFPEWAAWLARRGLRLRPTHAS